MEAIIHSDGWHGYNGLVDLGDKNTLESITGRRSLLEERPILTVLKASGVMLNRSGKVPQSVGENRLF